MQIFVRAAYADAALALDVQPSHTAAQVASRFTDAVHATNEMHDDVRLVHRGRTLASSATLASAGVGAAATLELLPRLRGGGGDGGSTGAESRSSYLEMYMAKRPDKVDPGEERLARWTTCRLSGAPLSPPCAADELGFVYNKEAAVAALVAKTVPAALAHLSSLKHLIDLRLERAAGAVPGAAVQFACPVTGAPLSGKGGRFVGVRRGGQGPAHVLSERALKEIPAVVRELVGGDWAPGDLLPLNPPAEELALLSAALEARREAERAAKRDKKAGRAGKRGAGAVLDGGDVVAAAAGAAGPAGAPAGLAAPPGGGDAALAAKKKKARTAAELAPAGADQAVWNSLFTSSKAPLQGNDYMLRGGHRLA